MDTGWIKAELERERDVWLGGVCFRLDRKGQWCMVADDGAEIWIGWDFMEAHLARSFAGAKQDSLARREAIVLLEYKLNKLKAQYGDVLS